MKQQDRRRCVKRERKTRFVEIFRTTPTRTVCPNFYVLAHANGCTFSPRCSYCYLQSSFWYLKEQQAFTNIDKMEREIRAWIARDELESYILNMGNLSDSFAFEAVRPLVRRLVEVFREAAAGRRHALLLVTKAGTRDCRSLFEVEPCGNVIISFSVNSPGTARKHEKGAASVQDRLRAARRLKSEGWRIRIRLDPMILGFDYRWIIAQVKRLAPERVTLGSLRAERNLDRFTDNGLLSDLEPCRDEHGLARYPKEQRLALYRPAVRAFRAVCPVGLCEETPDVWRALGLSTRAATCNCGS